MASKKNPTPSENNSISISGDVKDSVVIIGDNNKTFFQKVINIFKSDSESMEQRNRRILLNHVENAWIKGVLDASLHGAALLDLGIKEDPEAVTKYPWAVKKDSTDETLPAGTSMLEIFDTIGMGRSLLILGAPGSGKTTMLLELARGLIARAREDITQPIPMVFNLSSWTESKTLADWLAQELNNLYSVPRKTAPEWVKGDKLLLLLDGLDEVRQDSRAKCVEAINAFRKEHGLTSLAVCSRSQDYADLKAKLSFEGAIEVQPLTQGQITEFFNRFGDEMAGIKQVLEKDATLREVAETPLFLSIMIIAYRDKRDVDIVESGEGKVQRKHLFDTYIERMFERSQHPKTRVFKKKDVLNCVAWLAHKMNKHNQITYLIERMQPDWFDNDKQRYLHKLIIEISIGTIFSLIMGLILGLSGGLDISLVFVLALVFGVMVGWFIKEMLSSKNYEIKTVDKLNWSWKQAGIGLMGGLIGGLITGLIVGLIGGIFGGISIGISLGLFVGLIIGLVIGLSAILWGTNAAESHNLMFNKMTFGVYGKLIGEFRGGLSSQNINQTTFPGQRIYSSTRNAFISFLINALSFGLLGRLFSWVNFNMTSILMFGLIGGLYGGLNFGGLAVIQHYVLRLMLNKNKLLPWRLVPFLDHCVDLIFLRRVGGGYIFVHRLLMEHFAEMYAETPTSQGNQK